MCLYLVSIPEIWLTLRTFCAIRRDGCLFDNELQIVQSQEKVGGFRTTTKLSCERGDVSIHDFLTHYLRNVYKITWFYLIKTHSPLLFLMFLLKSCCGLQCMVRGIGWGGERACGRGNHACSLQCTWMFSCFVQKVT